MPLYGCVLWDFSCNLFERFCTAWRKSVRYLMEIPRRTHCNIIHLICNDKPIKEQLYNRVITFLKNLIKSENHLCRLCAELVTQGSGSAVSNNLTVISDYYQIPRNIINNNTHKLLANKPLLNDCRMYF